MESQNTNKINCYHCKHFYTTWDPKFPRGCKFLGFKTAKLPSITVYESTGTPCIGFEKKNK